MRVCFQELEYYQKAQELLWVLYFQHLIQDFVQMMMFLEIMEQLLYLDQWVQILEQVLILLQELVQELVPGLLWILIEENFLQQVHFLLILVQKLTRMEKQYSGKRGGMR